MLMRRYGWPSSTWSELDRLRRRMNRLAWGRPMDYTWRAAPSFPAINVWTNDEGGIVTAELPGVDLEKIDISVQGDTLTLHGSCNPDGPQEDVTYHRRERGTGAFSRTVQLPFQVEADEVEATFEKGVLNILLPRAESDKPKKIAIKAG